MEDIGEATTRVEIVRYGRDGATTVPDLVAREEPLEVRLNGRPLVYLMRLPGDDVVLAAGFCLSEGLVKERGQFELISHCLEGDAESLERQAAAQGPATGSGEGEARVAGETGGSPGNLVEIEASMAIDAERFTTARVIRTGCGGADLDREVDLDGIEVAGDTMFSPSVISSVPDRLLARQDVFKSTGGTHGAGAFDADGAVMVVKEDVGRHNAVDKVLGHLLLAGEEFSDKGLILSGRLSYEMVLKAARAGIPLVCSVSAPTALGVEVGVRTGVTLVGFLRDGSFNVYCHPRRIGGA